MEIILYHNLNEDLIEIRTRVFIDEQGFQNEFDEHDKEADHLAVYENSTPIGCLRFYQEEDHYRLGRLAILKPYRKQGYGSQLIKEAEKQIRLQNGNKIVLSAQVYAKDFYSKLGYTSYGEEYLEEITPHIDMQKELKP